MQPRLCNQTERTTSPPGRRSFFEALTTLSCRAKQAPPCRPSATNSSHRLTASSCAYLLRMAGWSIFPRPLPESHLPSSFSHSPRRDPALLIYLLMALLAPPAARLFILVATILTCTPHTGKRRRFNLLSGVMSCQSIHIVFNASFQ